MVPGLLKYSNPLPLEAPVKLLSGSKPSTSVHKNKFLPVNVKSILLIFVPVNNLEGMLYAKESSLNRVQEASSWKGSPTSPNPPPLPCHHRSSTATFPAPKSCSNPLKVVPAGIVCPALFTRS